MRKFDMTNVIAIVHMTHKWPCRTYIATVNTDGSSVLNAQQKASLRELSTHTRIKPC